MSARTINRDHTQVRAPSPLGDAERPRRLCRTPEEIFQAGWDDGVDDPPLTAAQVTHLAALLAPYIQPDMSTQNQLKTA
jgi:hypothetical protein